MSAATRPRATRRRRRRRETAVVGARRWRAGGTDLLSSSGGGGAALRVVGGGGHHGGAVVVVVVGRAAHRIRERGAEVAGDRSDSHLFFVGFFFSFFFPLLFLLWVGFGEASRVVSPCVRPCARLLLVWASRRVALFFFFWSRWRPSVRACVRKYGPPSTQAKRRRRCGFSYSSCERICPLLTRRFLLLCNTLLRR